MFYKVDFHYFTDAKKDKFFEAWLCQGFYTDDLAETDSPFCYPWEWYYNEFMFYTQAKKGSDEWYQDLVEAFYILEVQDELKKLEEQE